MEFNKILGAVLTAGIAFSALGLISDDLSHPHLLKKSVLDIKGVETAAPAAVAAAAPASQPLPVLLAKADPAAGEAYTKKICIACHNFQEGGANKVGPALYGVVGREKASAPGYTYSAALKGKGGKWTFADLNTWLTSPKAYAPGTKMAYAGIENEQARANVIDYLHTLSKDPEPLPPVTAADKAAAAAPGAAPAAEQEAATPPFDVLLAKADPERGQAFTRKICIACHNFQEGAANKVGPVLYGVVGRDKASAPGYTYSAALKSKGGKWTLADLNTWLTSPKAYAPGTKMSYAGIPSAQTRADVVDYLRTLSKNPEPLPGGGAAKPVEKASATSPAPAASAPAPASSAAAPAAASKPGTSSTAPAQPDAAKPAEKAAAGNASPAKPSAPPTVPTTGSGTANTTAKPPVGASAPDQPAVVQPAPVKGGTDHPTPSGQQPTPATGEPPSAPAKPQ